MIILSPYSQPLPCGKDSPKSYPWWDEVVHELRNRGKEVIQVGAMGERPIQGTILRLGLTYPTLMDLVLNSETWVSVDNFFPHMCSHIGKPGVVVWSLSDPLIFGYTSNVNLLKSRDYLRKGQFKKWDGCDFCKEAFVGPNVVSEAILKSCVCGLQ